jgi:hypothetical protein
MFETCRKYILKSFIMQRLCSLLSVSTGYEQVNQGIRLLWIFQKGYNKRYECKRIMGQKFSGN